MRRSGFTLIEMMIVVVIISLVTLMTAPRVRGMMVGAGLRGARSSVVTLYNQARMAAQRANKPAALRVVGNRVWVVRATTSAAKASSGCRCDTIGAVQFLDTLYKVTVSATTDSIHILPSGIGGLVGGSDAVIRLVRDSRTDSVTISPYGKVK